MSQPHHLEIQTVITKLKQQYQKAVNALRSAIVDYAQDGKLPDVKQRAEGLFAYPQLTVHWSGEIKKRTKQELMGVCLAQELTLLLLLIPLYLKIIYQNNCNLLLMLIMQLLMSVPQNKKFHILL